MARAVIAIILLMLAGCASLPPDAVTWRGHAPGRVKAKVTLFSPALPAQGWLVESEPDQAAGYLSYTKWGPSGERYWAKAYFQVRQAWEPEAEYLGRFETKDGFSELCVGNPVHGGFQEGDTYVFTNAYDYCARLARR
ncbi:MAG: hypothetical protein ACREPD_07340 [Stenotrophomonas sp.]|uniref:hypothetical protein n=1 Tax=Stenotrophomonas sp. TaxID=69392 RepID=UPI003D6D99E6